MHDRLFSQTLYNLDLRFLVKSSWGGKCICQGIASRSGIKYLALARLILARGLRLARYNFNKIKYFRPRKTTVPYRNLARLTSFKKCVRHFLSKNTILIKFRRRKSNLAQALHIQRHNPRKTNLASGAGSSASHPKAKL